MSDGQRPAGLGDQAAIEARHGGPRLRVPVRPPARRATSAEEPDLATSLEVAHPRPYDPDEAPSVTEELFEEVLAPEPAARPTDYGPGVAGDIARVLADNVPASAHESAQKRRLRPAH
jgi:hypothetical protein